MFKHVEARTIASSFFMIIRSITISIFCKYSNMPLNTRIKIGLETYRFTMQNTITEDKLTNTFEVGDKMTGDAPTARTGLALCHRVILDSVAHWWFPAWTPTVHQCHYGGKPCVAQDTLHATPSLSPKRQDQGLQRHALFSNMEAELVC